MCYIICTVFGVHQYISLYLILSLVCKRVFMKAKFGDRSHILVTHRLFIIENENA